MVTLRPANADDGRMFNCAECGKQFTGFYCSIHEEFCDDIHLHKECAAVALLRMTHQLAQFMERLGG